MLRIYNDYKSLTCDNFNSDKLLRWKLILEECGSDIEYIKGDKKMVADSLSGLTFNGNQETTQKYTYQKEIVSEINDIEEIPEGAFTIHLKLIQKYQRTEPSLMDKYKDGAYHKCSFFGVSIANFILITCKDKIVIPSILQRYVLHWYHTYLLHPGMDRTEATIFQHLYWPNIR